MITELTTDDKLRLLRFVSSFAWADLSIDEGERGFVRELIGKLDLPEAAAKTALTYLEHPPAEDELDPYDIPDEHKKVFLEFTLEMVAADGEIDRMEVENFAIFEAMMTGDMGDVLEVSGAEDAAKSAE